MNQVVTLIGYRGTGKSTLAPMLARALGWTHVDSDIVIETTTGRTIAEIFADSGEPAFRRMERETIADLLKNTQQVLSVGGGAILNADTRKQLRQAGPVVWLTAEIDTILKRINNDQMTQQRRPNLTQHASQRDEITAVLSARSELYEEAATFVVPTDRREPAAICDAILNELAGSAKHGDSP